MQTNSIRAKPAKREFKRNQKLKNNKSKKTENGTHWRLGLGAEVLADGVRFRVWAPRRKSVEVVIADERKMIVPLEPEGSGYFSGFVPDIGAGVLYWYRLNKRKKHPDPCSRFQPEGPHGPSMIVDPRAYRWGDSEWRGVDIEGQVLYELHIGTFTREGTFDSAALELEELKRIGITLIEVLPIAEFDGRWNWGYDGVGLYAPAHVYGNPDSVRRFVDAAHAVGLGVILDVVYNHFGPSGNYLKEYSDHYFTDRYDNDWGDAINFDGPESQEVREFFIRNACYWINEFHMDGLRLDATQQIFDASPVHVISELSQRARDVAGRRKIVLVAENEPQDVVCLAPVEKGGYGLDAMWNDDFHHSARVALTGRREAYYTDYRGEPQEFISMCKRGFLYQGQRYKWQNNPRGSVVTTEPACAFVLFTQNHDQVANSLYGQRIHTMTSPERYRAITTLMLFAPGTPMFFMGQEFGSSSPFLYFADHSEEVLAESVHEGRKEFLSQFPSYGSPESQERIPDPGDISNFERSKLDLSERTSHEEIYLFHQDLLRLRREDPVIAAQKHESLDGAVLGLGAFVLRFFGQEKGDRLLVVNLGVDLEYDPAPEPLLAPVKGGAWHLIWSSGNPRYGGRGIVNPNTEEGWRLPGETAVLFSSVTAVD